MVKPIIGITPDFNPGNRKDMGGKEPTYFLRARYLQAIQDAGGVPLVLPLVRGLTKQKYLIQRLDGLLVTGSGADLAPELYGEKQRYPFQRMSEERAQLELGLSRLAFRQGLPTLGICGGMQSMNVALGGTLVQDISSQLSTKIEHRPTKSATKTAHLVNIEPNSLLQRIAKRLSIAVNSSHHQSIKSVPSSFQVTGVAPDGVIEAIEASRHPFWLGVQWHPEFLYRQDAIQKRLFTALIQSARQFAASRT
ncbi:MAG: gamma-glutamyl-gamma-aminobutyrate hydrolase family protein [Nitrospiraceae bacterium]|nr:gamma-glutamyl-gamma-aminobutyrate hydrolase family protein [Nitrospira sp.]MCA9456693.1 gamma-glutamyl-gamma-aminobutyrate hydrolase family protein [Nitrospira sp.]MCB9774435.1 gamma-glutamyl-gamma-aminobutyrate hydrolase family protein [Nitrospiraceae bacterium]MCW5784259.1 gamma-glutamyl-gamma-aminobutyrate hydrolase family protein [Nitrospirales bacterium]